MTGPELKSWVQRTADRFPQIAQLFERATDREDLAASWSMALGEVSLDDANRFVDAMLKGDPEPPTYIGDWAKLPGMLRRWLRENKPLVAQVTPTWTEQRTYRCLHCWDKGYGVEIFNPEWIRSFATEIELRELATGWQREARRWCRDHGCGPLTFSCDCSCEEGRELHDLRKHKRMQFEPGNHCEVPPGGENGWADALAEWIAGRDLMEEANRWEYAP